MLSNACMVRKQNDYSALTSLSGTARNDEKKALNDALYAIGQNKDRNSFIRIFQHFAPRVKSFLMKGGASEAQADELAQETMLSVWDKASTFNPAHASASTWIFTIARNKRIDAMRKGNRTEIDLNELDNTLQGDDASPLETLAATQESALISKALLTLPEEQAELIKKSFFEDKSHADIAKETGIPLGTVKSRIRLALDRLRNEQKMAQL